MRWRPSSSPSALSPLLPIGLARRTEPGPAVHADWLVLGLGAVAIVLVVTAIGALSAWRQARAAGAATRPEAQPPATPTALSRVLGSAALPCSVATGVRLALVKGRGRRTIPVTSLLIGAAIGVAAVTAAATYAAGLARLVAVPRHYGAAGDAVVGNYADADTSATGAHLLAADPDVAAYAGENSTTMLVDGREVSVIQRFPGQGGVPIAVLDGREPIGPGEIVLGQHTLRALGKRIGDTVTLATVSPPSPPRQVSIVGSAVLNSQNDVGIEPGKGGLIQVAAGSEGGAFPGGYVVRFKDGVDPDDAADRLRSTFYASTLYPALPPTVVLNVVRVSYLPTVLAAVVIALALGTLVHGLTTVIRRRRGELAVMRAVGFTATR